MKYLRVGFWFLALFLGVLHTWSSRHRMNPDGIAYLDLADACLRHGWGNVVHAYWSPLYPLLISLAFLTLKPSPYWEFPVVHLVNFVIYLFSLCCFEFFLRRLIDSTSKRLPEHFEGECMPLPGWALVILGYPLFIWSSLYLIQLSVVTPDMLVAGFVYLSSGLLLHIRNGSTTWPSFLYLGVALGLGYWAKAIMFPLAIVFLVLGLFSAGGVLRSLPRVFLSFIIFLIIAGPLIVSLSKEKNRLTFGESGRLAYLWFTNEVSYPHWKGSSTEFGVPEHPTRKIFDDPAVYEFGTPYKTTYAAWYDPTYWFQGVNPRFNLSSQINRIATNLRLYYNMFFNVVHFSLMVGLLTLYLVNRRWLPLLDGLARVWILLTLSVTVLVIYLLVWVEERYVGALLIIMWLSLFAAVRLPKIPGMRRVAGAATLAVSIMVTAATLLPSSSEAYDVARDLLGGVDASQNLQWQVAESLRAVGIQTGEELAYVGPSFQCYWARLARVRIIAEIESPEEFWSASDFVRGQVMDRLVQAGAKALVTEQMPPGVAKTGWEQLNQTGYYIYRLY